MKGQNVFLGYHNLPEKTTETFAEDGWLKTGDLASIDDEGHITLTGRAKRHHHHRRRQERLPHPDGTGDLAFPIVEHAVVVGDNRPFVGAVITLDKEGLASWLPTQKLPADLTIEQAAGLPEVAAEIQKYVDRANTNVSRAESVRKFIVLPTTFPQDNKCLTPSMKVVRPKVNQVFKEQIDNQLYVGKR